MTDKPRNTRTIRVPDEAYWYLRTEAHAWRMPIGEYINQIIQRDKHQTERTTND